tara:strand:- start:271 stop:411 length:141 start_codon:yes stop_codon:yes gene_type:complete
MSIASKVFLLFFLVAFIGAIIAFLAWDVSPPDYKVEETIPKKQIFK